MIAYVVRLVWSDGFTDVLGISASDATARILADGHTDIYSNTDDWVTDQHGHSVRWLNPTRCLTIRPMEVLA